MKHLSQYPAVSRRLTLSTAGALIAIVASACGSDTNAQVKSATDHASYIESTRCAGVQGGPDVNAVLSGQAVTGVRPLYGAKDPSKSDVQDTLQGATVTVAAQPGMTAEWLDRVLECHSAAETLGQTAGYRDPFYLPDAVVEIMVQPARDGFAINVSTASQSNAQRILDRATAWVSQRPPAVSSR
jgi:hypothetical protein